MPKVAVFSTDFLQYSQTFVYQELLHLKRYTADVFCKERMNAERFAFDRVHVGGPLYGLTFVDRGFDRIFTRERFSVVHAHFGRGALYAVRYAKRHRLPLVVTFHGYDVPLLTSLERFRPRYLRYGLLGPGMLTKMTLGLCASVELLQMLVDYGVPGDRLRLHHIGIDTDAFSGEPPRSTEEARVIMIGRFIDKKGFEYGLRAFAKVAAARMARLSLVGDGELGERLRSLATELNVADRVEFTGVLSSPEVAERLRRSHVLLAPSVVGRAGNRESGLLTVKEASACGVVPIGTLHGGIPEIIEDGTTGFLVPERDVDALADRLTRVLDDPAFRERLGRAARRKMVEEYDVRRRVEALESYYDEATAMGGATGAPSPN